ncbi:MAG: DUF4253 domain-containing protein [Planctomycetota bacterium]
MSTFDEALATLPIALPKPVRFARRAAVRMRGAIVCEAAGYVGRPYDSPTDGHFNMSSLELMGPRVYPAWKAQIQRDGDKILSVGVSRWDAPYAEKSWTSSRAGDEGWAAELSESGHVWKIRARLPTESGSPSLEFECRLEWPVAAESRAVPREIVALLEKHTGIVPRAFSTWEFGRAKDSECASVILDSDDDANAALGNIRGDLPKGWVAFLGSRRWLDNPDLDGVELVVAPGNGWADMLRAARLDPVNSGLSTEAVVTWLTEYDRTMGIDVIGVSTDHLTFDLRDGPYDEALLADDLTHLCGDLRNESRSVVEDMVESGRIHLWWD